MRMLAPTTGFDEDIGTNIGHRWEQLSRADRVDWPAACERVEGKRGQGGL
jgi:hypothetical protein